MRTSSFWCGVVLVVAMGGVARGVEKLTPNYAIPRLAAPGIVPQEAKQSEFGPREIYSMPRVVTPQSVPMLAAKPAEFLAPDSADAVDARLQKKLTERDAIQREIDALRKETGTPEQVSVNVRMMEVNLTAMRKLGMKVSWLKDGKVLNAEAASALGLDGKSVSYSQPGDVKPVQLPADWVETLSQRGLARVLCEPTVVAVSGREASINIGGEVPVPNMDGKGATGFRSYGTEVRLKADVLGNNRVRLHVAPRVSELDQSRAVAIGEQKVPAMTVRECDFTTEVEFGEQFMLSGLIQERTEVQVNETGRSNQVQEVALVVLVKPELVK